MTNNASTRILREHILKLLEMLASRTDSISRTEIYRKYAADHNMREHKEIFDDMLARDQSHLNWLKKQILHNIHKWMSH